MFCKNCGAELKEGSQFCGNCGAQTGVVVNNNKVKDRKINKKIIGVIIGIVVIIAAVIGIVAGTGSNNSIIGTWVSEDGEEVLIFEENGSCSVPFTYNSSWWESCDRYSIADDGTLVLSSSQGNISAERYTLTDSRAEVTENSGYYYLSADTLIFHDGSNIYTYNR